MLTLITGLSTAASDAAPGEFAAGLSWTVRDESTSASAASGAAFSVCPAVEWAFPDGS